jgi:hypothetical protein
MAGAGFLAFMVLLLRLTLAPALGMLLGFFSTDLKAGVQQAVATLCRTAKPLHAQCGPMLAAQLLTALLVCTTVGAIATLVFDVEMITAATMAAAVFAARLALLPVPALWNSSSQASQASQGLVTRAEAVSPAADPH